MKLNKKKNSIILILLLLLALSFLTWVLYHITGVNTGCITKAFTGLPCPGCGMTRAWLSVFHLDFQSAFFYHPLFLLPVLIVLLLFLETVCHIKMPGWFYIISLALLLCVYIIRMSLYFPNTEPMAFDQNAYLPRFIWRIKLLL
ncbi:DUF2752 domain-containing protein [bacterium C-53]|nr:DUF2752 domain-containing protein [Lachnospiraceae bacterium]NBI04403.1 DUF2752 domain-containing protein [Lachnospiraceae bacterium]RKJ08298.1 DUF2752 domain-containing protein [bacterium C-53]